MLCQGRGFRGRLPNHLCHEFSHGFRRLFLHLVGDIAVYVQRECRRVVPQHGGERFGVHTILQHQGGEGMPLRYNYDKPEKPRIFKGFEVCQADYSSFSNLKNQTEK